VGRSWAPAQIANKKKTSSRAFFGNEGTMSSRRLLPCDCIKLQGRSPNRVRAPVKFCCNPHE
jgi:hypothetical protein